MLHFEEENTKSYCAIERDDVESTAVELIRALNVIFPGTGPGGYFGSGSHVRTLDDEARGNLMICKVARTLVRAWMEKNLAEYLDSTDRTLKPSLQIELKPNRPFPNVSLKWNKATRGTTDRLRIESATIRYLEERFLTWGNNRSPNNNYVAGSTLARAFEAQSKTVYFDHLAETGGTPVAHEAFTGRTPGVGDIEVWIFLANEA